MKKVKGILSTLFLLCLVSQSFGQRGGIWWFDTGLKIQYGATGMYNQAIVDSETYDYDISTGISFGGKLGINYDAHGLAIDVMYSTWKQSFEFVPDQVNEDIEWNAIDVYMLYRNNANLGYFEIGPKASLIREVNGISDGESTEFTDDYNGTAFSGVIGFGAYVLGNDGRFSGVLGLRFEYGFSDMIKKTRQDISPPLYDESIYTDGYKKSVPIFAGLVFELNWGIGYFGKATCGARSKFIMF